MPETKPVAVLVGSLRKASVSRLMARILVEVEGAKTFRRTFMEAYAAWVAVQTRGR